MNYSYKKSYLIASQKTTQEKIEIELLFQAVEEMINELVPIIVDKYLKENNEKISLNIQTLINGKAFGSEKIIDEIHNLLENELSN